jgi:hypothetical protein
MTSGAAALNDTSGGHANHRYSPFAQGNRMKPLHGVDESGDFPASP